jgi:toxin ParE1/3/4
MVKWTLSAKADLKSIYDYITHDSKFYAREVLLEIVKQSKTLDAFPKIGREVPEIGDPKVREIFIYSYRLIYEIFNDRIDILAIVHGKRDFSN